MALPPSDLFSGTAEYYERFRPKYPPESFEYLKNKFALNENARVLDLGCGTGQVTFPLAEMVKEVVAIDPEPEMIEEGKRQAHLRAVTTIDWRVGRAEDIEKNLGLFRLATFGASFHWMDAEVVLDKAYEHLAPNGGIAILYNITGFFTKDQQGALAEDAEHAWKNTRKEVLEKYLGPKRRAGSGFFVSAASSERFEKVLARSRFRELQTWNYTYDYQWDLDSLVGNLYSMSFASRKLFGDRVEEFEKELRAELLKVEPSGIFNDSLAVEIITARR